MKNLCQNKIPMPFQFVVLLIFLLPFLLLGCDTPPPDGDETASVVFTLNVADDSIGAKASARGIDCNETGIKSIAARMYDDHGAKIGEIGAVDCGAHKAQFNNILVGPNRKIIVFAFDQLVGINELEKRTYEGAKGGLNIKPNIVNYIGEITLAKVSSNSTGDLNPVKILQPADNSVFEIGTDIVFQGSATDPNEGALTGASLVWTSNIDGNIGTGESFTISTLTEGGHTIELAATNSSGTVLKNSIKIIVGTSGTGEEPTQNVQILQPDNNSVFESGTEIEFKGGAVDLEGNAILGENLIWTSSIDGNIGSGVLAKISTLSIGNHNIELTALKNQEIFGKAAINITITAADCFKDASVKIIKIEPTVETKLLTGQNYSFIVTLAYDFKLNVPGSIIILVRGNDNAGNNKIVLDDTKNYLNDSPETNGEITATVSATISASEYNIKSVSVAAIIFAEGYENKLCIFDNKVFTVQQEPTGEPSDQILAAITKIGTYR